MAKITHYDINDVWTPQATFTVGGVATDPTHLTVSYQKPDGTITSLITNQLVSNLTGSSTPASGAPV